MNYRESISYLEKAVSFGIKPGLERISALLKYLGNPEKKYKIIHVTGTNGKGSTTAMITAALEAAHIKAGRYVSPHLVEYTEAGWKFREAGSAERTLLTLPLR